MPAIKHIWFDFSDTIGKINREVHNKLLYKAYAEAVGKEVSPELIEEYKSLFEKHKSNSAVFTSLGLPSDFLVERIQSVPLETIYQLADPDIPAVLPKLKDILPISIFSNTNLDRVLPVLGIDAQYFTNILGPDRVKEPKPFLEGFYKMVELSGIPAENILYIGDIVDKDIIPAKKIGMVAGIIWGESSEADYSFKNFKEILKLAEKDFNIKL